MDGFPYSDETSVRFRDTDAMGMAHHAVILTYLEEARTAYLFELLDMETLDDIGFTIARVECDYRSPASYGDDLETGVRVTEIGDCSFEMQYRIEQADSGDLVAEATTIQVQYDYQGETATPLPDDFEERVREFERRRGTDQFESQLTEPS